jgi:hypothetical protein
VGYFYIGGFIMHKEVVVRSKITSLVTMIFICELLIIMSDVTQNIRFFGHRIAGYSKLMAIIFLIIILYKEITKCKLKYKYSIIADQFIVYRICNGKQEILENIKVKNIQSIDKIWYRKLNIHNFMAKKYTSLIVTPSMYCCIYKINNKNEVFYFQPSENLVEKLKDLKNKSF